MSPPPTSPDLQLGPWRFEEPLGAGGSGLVWRVTHVATGRRGALKGLTRVRSSGSRAAPPLRQDTSGMSWASSREAIALARLDHPHIAPILDEGRVPRTPPHGLPFLPGTPWFVMELAVGGPLTAHLERLDWPRLSATLAAILRALAHAHAAGLLHRDVKPSNIVVAASVFSPRAVRLVDFGLALAPPGARIGTPAYMAPEQAAGRADAEGPWSDLFGLGATAWHLATGRPPFGGLSSTRLEWSLRMSTPPPFAPRFEVPRAFERWLRDLLAPEPEARPQCAAEALTRLAALRHDDHDGPHHGAADAGPPTGSSLLTDATRPSPAVGQSLVTLDAMTFPDEVRLDARESLMPRRLLPLVGRRREEERLAAAREDALSRRAPRVVVITGPPGIGASRLMTQAVSDSAERVSHVLARTHGADELPRLVAELLGVPASASRDRVIERMRHIGLSAWLADAIVALLRGSSEGAEALLVQIVAALAKKRLVLVAHDQTPPPAALALAARAAGGDKALTGALLVLVATSDEALVARLAAAGAEVLALDPLDAVAQGVLLRRLLGLEPELAARVEARAGGHPGYLVMLLRHWIESGQLVESPAGWTLASSARDLPEDLVHATRETLAVWSPDERRALRLAALSEAPLTFERWCRAAPGLPIAQLAGRAIALGQLTPRADGGLALASPTLRDVLRDEIDDLPAAHRAWADALAAGPAPEALEPVALALHLAAIDAPEAPHHLVAAAQDRIAAGSFADALRLGRDALARLPADAAGDDADASAIRADATLAVAEARWRLGDHGALGDIERLAAASSGSERTRALRLAAHVLRIAGEIERAESIYDALIAETNDPLARLGRVSVLCSLGRLDEAERELESVTPLLDAPHDRLSVLRVTSVLRRVRLDYQGQLAIARELYALAEGLGSLDALAAATTDVAGASIELGLYDEAFEALSRSRELGLAAGRADVALDELNFAWLHLRRDEDAAAEPHLEEALRALALLGWQPPLAAAHGLAGLLHARRGDWQRADLALSAMHDIVDAIELRDPMIATALSCVAEHARASGEHARADALEARAAAQWTLLGRPT